MSQGLGMVEKSVRTMLRNKRAGRVTWEHQAGGRLSKKLSGSSPQPLEPDAEYQYQADGARDGEGEVQTCQQIHDARPVQWRKIHLGKGHSNAMGLYSGT